MYNKSSFELLQAAIYYQEAFQRIESVQELPMPLIRVFNVGTAGASCPNYLNRQRPFFGRCFCCGKSGHIKRFCPPLANSFCPKCKSKGHLIDACNADIRSFKRARPGTDPPINSRARPTNRDDVKSALPQSISSPNSCSHMGVNLQISDTSFRFEWDPRCSCCLISEAAWNRLLLKEPSLQLTRGRSSLPQMVIRCWC